MREETVMKDQLTLTEVGVLLDMRKPNVRKYLERHGVMPVARKDGAAGDVWALEDVQPLVQQRREKRASNRRRSDAAKQSIAARGPYRARSVDVSRLGPTQRQVLIHMAEHDHQLPPFTDSVRLAFKRLQERRLVRERNGERQLTATGTVAAAALRGIDASD